ncbi:MAG: M48 family metalloprotease [bacterium]|nr:M48 family metalloprotease [bacterium]
MSGRRGVVLIAIWAALSACNMAAVRENPPTGGDMSLEKEIELTAEIHTKIRSQARFISDPIVLDFVYELAEELVSVTDPQPFVYRYSVIDDDTLNAFTIGGGYVYINSEVIAQAGDISELAGVLAHEIAHVRERHVARRSEGQGLATLITLASVAAVALAGGDPSLLAIGQGINVSLQLKNTRKHEAEADREGIGYMVATGYHPDGMSRFFQRILATYPSRDEEIPAYLYSHPDVKERIAAARVEIDRIGAPRNLQRRDERLPAIQSRLAKISTIVAGGSGLQARAKFDRSLTDPLLREAHQAREAEDFESAAKLLEQASSLSPEDPRVAIEQGQVLEALNRLEEARTALERAFRIDPNVPLVQERLGVLHQRLGNRSRAVFFLELAADSFRPGSAARRRAEFEIKRISFPVLASSTLGGVSDVKKTTRVIRGNKLVWWGDIRRSFMGQNPALIVRWRNPAGEIAREENLRMSPAGRVSSKLDTRNAPLGSWNIEIRVGTSLIEEREFELVAAAGI